jgi:hypothetical protein
MRRIMVWFMLVCMVIVLPSRDRHHYNINDSSGSVIVSGNGVSAEPAASVLTELYYAGWDYASTSCKSWTSGSPQLFPMRTDDTDWYDNWVCVRQRSYRTQPVGFNTDGNHGDYPSITYDQYVSGFGTPG